jgi:hypothetical protein
LLKKRPAASGGGEHVEHAPEQQRFSVDSDAEVDGGASDDGPVRGHDRASRRPWSC